jgi:septum formation protein
VRFSTRAVDLDERLEEGEPVTEYVARLAREKARVSADPGELVLAADTTVAVGQTVLGKPRDEREARQMLRKLAGRAHQVASGVALFDVDTDRLELEVVSSRVRIAEMSDEEIRWYVETGEPADKAGAYAIQGLGALFVEEIEGNYTNVVGLPLPATARLFRRLGFELLDFRDAAPDES